ncbi:PAS domain-containing sensor histidine kinase [Trinickia caryophylli]|uniref:Oxygen sensor histidine kinase NreB n=1 Tax=Trinickia caryophylli TaxID=28094 RepID=A0A1X7GP96_TRICW|nr:PAS domain-containing sensor histidine kinase [Trinickia caryophylli]WQE13585.1 PAS domain-containing sensor histidine kinase [Trinickia caryophylli]GLU35099.1 hypothetical protein Busp01_49410 [Trinickia caryophylli]SMF72591.1 PAS domain S-box-containing protein [Trinickia caryophylli]
MAHTIPYALAAALAVALAVLVWVQCARRREAAALSRTIDELHASEARYRGLVEISPVATWINRDNAIAFLNPACLALLGAGEPGQILGRSPFDIVHPDCHQHVRRRIERLAGRPGVQLDTATERVVRLDGEVREVEVKAVGLDDPGHVSILVTLLDVTERNQIERELLESQRNLRALSRSLDDVREDERAKLARELHEGLGQSLAALKMKMYALDGGGHAGPPGGRHALVHSASEHVDELVALVRRLAAELRPPMLDDLGLVAAVEWLAGEFSLHSGVTVTLDMEEVASDARVATAAYRIAQEALTNIARHARAQLVWVSLRSRGDTLVLRVRDDGIGIGPDHRRSPSSFGLLSIRERVASLGGTLDIVTDHGQGLELTVCLPLHARERTAQAPTPI